MARIDDVLDGPWVNDANAAKEWLEGHAANGAEDQRELRTVFRPHWEAVPGRRATELRSSFDAALTPLMLAELAIATGYVSEGELTKKSRAMLKELLWSPFARRYVDDYDYINVRYLAARVGTELGLPPVQQPQKIEAPTLFASFLADFRDWYQDEELDVWLHFLDDFVVIDNEAPRFERFLVTGKQPRDHEAAERFAALLPGLNRFLLSLESVFASLPISHRGMFGLVHIYWIAAFFGCELEDGEYVQNYIDWGPSVEQSPLVTKAGKALWTSSVATLRDVFDRTRALVENVKSGAS